MDCPFCRSEVRTEFSHLRWQLDIDVRTTIAPGRSSHCPSTSWTMKSTGFFLLSWSEHSTRRRRLHGRRRCVDSSTPWGCSEEGHGYSYARRSATRDGCLVSGCPGSRRPLDMDVERFPPSFRLQDELHLLKDSLGSVDAHYEALFDSLQHALTGHIPKVLASSATLSGYQNQVDALYRRQGRVFPVPGPESGIGFWSADTDKMSRRFIAIAPRGQTTDFAVDRIVATLQMCIRRFVAEPDVVCNEIGIEPVHLPESSPCTESMLSMGTLYKFKAASRSLETQIPFPIESASLTGQTDFEEVRTTLGRLSEPEEEYEERLDVITASSMMSHGVDIDRLNIMIVIGLPLTASRVHSSNVQGR